MALRLGLIGRGRWGQAIERTLSSFPGVSVIHIPRGVGNAEALDGVLVATPSATHAEIALPYIEAGIPTFIEKPMATSVRDAERVCEVATRSGAPVFVGHIYLHHPAFLAALDLLPGLGTVRSLICEGANDRPRTDSSVLWDWLPHDLSMARVIFGQDADVVRAWKLCGDTQAEVAAAKFQFGDGGLVSFASWHSPIRVRRTTIVGTAGVLVFDDNADRKLVLQKDGEVTYPSYVSELPLACEMEAFIHAVRSKQCDSSHLQVGMMVVRVIAAAERSMKADEMSV